MSLTWLANGIRLRLIRIRFVWLMSFFVLYVSWYSLTSSSDSLQLTTAKQVLIITSRPARKTILLPLQNIFVISNWRQME